MPLGAVRPQTCPPIQCRDRIACDCQGFKVTYMRMISLTPSLWRITLLILAIALPTAATANNCPPQIRVAYTDSDLSPYVLGAGSSLQEPPGLFVSWARSALRRLGCMEVVTENRLPYNRIISSMEVGTIDIRVSGVYRSQVAELMRFPTRNGTANRQLAIAESYTNLYVLKDAPGLIWDGNQLRFTGANPVIGTVRGHYTEATIKTRQWAYDSAPSWESNALKLLSGRVAAIAGPDSVIDELPGRDRMQTLLPPLQHDLNFAPVSLKFFEQYPDFTWRFWLEICRESRATFTRLPPCSLN